MPFYYSFTNIIVSIFFIAPLIPMLRGRCRPTRTWRMPTDAEWTELRKNCTWTRTSDYNGTGVAGRIVTSKTNGNHIFLPAAGRRNGGGLDDAGGRGYYWSSSLAGANLYGDYNSAYCVNFNLGSVNRSSFLRYLGQSVRPVLK